MKIVVDINHPAHVHYFKNFIWEMQRREHEILVTATNKKIIIELLNHYKIAHIKLPEYKGGILRKIIQIFYQDILFYKKSVKFKPDIFIGFGSIRAAHVAFILIKPFIALDDTEHAIHEHVLYVPFASAILTPNWFKKDFGKKHVRYQGYTELLYLQNNYFKPNPLILEKLSVLPGEIYSIVRLISWGAIHDIHQKGIPNPLELISLLEKYGKVFISSENELPEELRHYQIPIAPHEMHDALYYASLYVGEGATTASEAAILGTYSIYINTLYVGNIDDQEKRYGIAFQYNNPSDSIERIYSKINELLAEKNCEDKRMAFYSNLNKNTIDVNNFLVYFVLEFLMRKS